jgi:hypothetical protein
MNFQDFLLAGNNKREQQFGQNIFNGFSVQLLSEAFGIDQQMAQRIRNQSDQRGDIIHVNHRLQFLKPTVNKQELVEKQAYLPIHQYQLSQSMSGSHNGLEENFCSLEARKNIENPNNPDTYNPRAGSITRLTSNSFPILHLVQRSATRVNLYQVYVMLHFYTYSYCYIS